MFMNSELGLFLVYFLNGLFLNAIGFVMFLNLSAVLLIECNHLISLMSIVKSSRSSEHVAVRDLVAQWLSAVG